MLGLCIPSCDWCIRLCLSVMGQTWVLIPPNGRPSADEAEFIWNVLYLVCLELHITNIFVYSMSWFCAAFWFLSTKSIYLKLEVMILVLGVGDSKDGSEHWWKERKMSVCLLVDSILQQATLWYSACWTVARQGILVIVGQCSPRAAESLGRTRSESGLNVSSADWAFGCVCCLDSRQHPGPDCRHSATLSRTLVGRVSGSGEKVLSVAVSTLLVTPDRFILTNRMNLSRSFLHLLVPQVNLQRLSFVLRCEKWNLFIRLASISLINTLLYPSA